MARSTPDPLQHALGRLVGVLPRKDHARRWLDDLLRALLPGAVVDLAGDGALAWLHRRDPETGELLPMPVARWGRAQHGDGRVLEGLDVFDGHQRISIYYDEEGRVADRSLNGNAPGHLTALVKTIDRATDPFSESVAFVALLDTERQGPARVYYPVPVPGGVATVFSVGLIGARRALFETRVPADARFLVVDGLEGSAIGAGATREAALDAFHAEVARSLPKQRRVEHSATDDYDDDGNLIEKGAPMPLPPPPGPASGTRIVLGFEPPEAWRGDSTPPPFGSEGDGFSASFVIRGPSSDAAPVPPRPECVPYVVLPIEPSPAERPERGRWIRLLGKQGVTRHVVRIERPLEFTLVGADLLGFVDPRGLSEVLDRIDARAPKFEGRPEYEPYVRFRAREYRYAPSAKDAEAGLVFSSFSQGNWFDPASLDGDGLQAMVRRQVKVLRPVD